MQKQCNINIKKSLVPAWLAEYKCENCQDGSMIYKELSVDPIENISGQKFLHKCNSCSAELSLFEKFPKVELSQHVKIKLKME